VVHHADRVLAFHIVHLLSKVNINAPITRKTACPTIKIQPRMVACCWISDWLNVFIIVIPFHYVLRPSFQLKHSTKAPKIDHAPGVF
jgi:hypothetical protein